MLSSAATHEEAADILKQSTDPVEIVAQYRPAEYHNLETKILEIKGKMSNSKTGSLTTTQLKSLHVRY